MSDAFEKMDRMYRFQRYFYDLTRKYYLLGRDRLLARMKIADGENVLEIGCGTGRNLNILACRYPDANFFGLDPSAEMLKTAAAKIRAKNVELEQGLAGDFSFNKTFGLAAPFDAIFFSYSISMIPEWRQSITNALENLKPNGRLYIVDFYDQKDLPRAFQKILTAWLKQFHVRFWSDLIPHLESLDGELQIFPIARRYAFIAEFLKK